MTRLTAEDYQALQEVIARRAPKAIPVVRALRDGQPVDTADRERIRDVLTEELAERGFDEECGLSDDGVRLERLIDLLFEE
jgi:thioredoxin-like negative regulator of GroEL